MADDAVVYQNTEQHPYDIPRQQAKSSGNIRLATISEVQTSREHDNSCSQPDAVSAQRSPSKSKNKNLKIFYNVFIAATVLAAIALIAIMFTTIRSLERRLVASETKLEGRFTASDTRDDQLNETLSSLGNELSDFKNQQVLNMSCEEIKRAAPESQNGIYYIRDANGVEYPVFCDMATHGGGWTLVASIHENNLGTSGRCTAGDRWSSEQGNSVAHPNGDGNWENRNLFGHVTAAASDDYKNAAYFELQASDLMVLHVPNDTPPSLFVDNSTFQYRTTGGALTTYGGNLHELFKRYPIRANVYTTFVDNGLSFPVEFEKGSAQKILEQLGTNAQSESEAGYIQFRTINNERGAFAFCPGIRIRPNKRNVEHMCVGGSSLQGAVVYCGDFSAFDYYSSGAGHAWGSTEARKQTVFMIFYR